MPLGIVPVDETILTAPLAPEEAAAVSPDSPDPEYEAMLIQNPDLLEDMPYEEYKNLPPKQKEIVDRLLEGN
jgi:ABC-type Fe3+-hydroxamate transport system substrate-binding protein